MKKLLVFAMTALAVFALVACATTKNDTTIAGEINKSITSQNITDVDVKTTDRGVMLIAGALSFGADSAEITPETAKRLDSIGSLLKNYQNRMVLIVGHTADVGDMASQESLSLERAKAVAAYFVEKGILKADKITTEGHGGKEPIASNDTDEGKAKNRRVEITLLK